MASEPWPEMTLYRRMAPTKRSTWPTTENVNGLRQESKQYLPVDRYDEVVRQRDRLLEAIQKVKDKYGLTDFDTVLKEVYEIAEAVEKEMER